MFEILDLERNSKRAYFFARCTLRVVIGPNLSHVLVHGVPLVELDPARHTEELLRLLVLLENI